MPNRRRRISAPPVEKTGWKLEVEVCAHEGLTIDAGPHACRAAGDNVGLVKQIVVTLVLAGAVAATAPLLGCGGDRETPTATPSDETAAGTEPRDDFGFLGGRWVRPDGGYVLQSGGVGPRGELQATYFNPRSIHVSQASVARVNGESQVFIELRDTGYPGATYTLIHDDERDELTGLYYQPSAGRTFDVAFVRTE